MGSQCGCGGKFSVAAPLCSATAPFMVALAVLSCGIGAMPYTQPVWLAKTADAFTSLEWAVLTGVSGVSQLMTVLPGMALDRLGVHGPGTVCTMASIALALALGCEAVLLQSYTSMTDDDGGDTTTYEGPIALLCGAQALVGLASASVTTAALMSRAGLGAPRAARGRCFGTLNAALWFSTCWCVWGTHIGILTVTRRC